MQLFAPLSVRMVVLVQHPTHVLVVMAGLDQPALSVCVDVKEFEVIGLLFYSCLLSKMSKWWNLLITKCVLLRNWMEWTVMQ